MKLLPEYQFTPDMAKNLIDHLHKYDCNINLLLYVGGEPLFWEHLHECVSLFRKCGRVDKHIMITALVDGMEMSEYESLFDQINVSNYGDNRHLIDKYAVGNSKYVYYSRENQNYIPRGRLPETIPCECLYHHSWLLNNRIYYCQIAGPILLSGIDLKMSQEEMDSYSWTFDEFFLNVDEYHSEFGTRAICEACHNNPLVKKILGTPQEPYSVHGQSVYQIR